MSAGSLHDYFTPARASDYTYTDSDCSDISAHLDAEGYSDWAKIPRIYVVLRLINKVDAIEDFVRLGLNDLCLPFLRAAQLPRSLGSCRDTFIERQSSVLTAAVTLERGLTKQKHVYLSKDTVFPYESVGRLGAGRYEVDQVRSPLSGELFARKLFKRSQVSKNILKDFVNELNILKRIEHEHCVQLVASYTDSKHFGLLMTPVAECSLTHYLELAEHQQELRVTLRTFFGCLAAAVDYLHQSKIRHRDIKPDNILIKGKRVYLTDFGISLHWENLSRSTTEDESGRTPGYCAPEVAELFQKRNSATDIWSLGCVFTEMLVVTKGLVLEDLKRAFYQHSESRAFYKNTTIVYEWLDRKLQEPRPRVGQSISQLTKSMLASTPGQRPPAHTVNHIISSFRPRDWPFENIYCGDCCAADPEVTDDDSVTDSRLGDATLLKAASRSSVYLRNETLPILGDPISVMPLGRFKAPMSEPFASEKTQPPGQPTSAPAVSQPLTKTSLPPEESSVINKIVVADPQEDIAREQAQQTEALSAQSSLQISKPKGGSPLAMSDGPPLPNALDIHTETALYTEAGLPLQGALQSASVSDQASTSAKRVQENSQPQLKSLKGRNNLSSHNLKLVPRIADHVNSFEGIRLPIDQELLDRIDFNRWPTYNLKSNLPDLYSGSWTSAGRLWKAIRLDRKFMDRLRSAHPRQYHRLASSNVSDLLSIVHLLLYNGLDIPATRYSAQQVHNAVLSLRTPATPIMAVIDDMSSDGDTRSWRNTGLRFSMIQLIAAFHGFTDEVVQRRELYPLPRFLSGYGYACWRPLAAALASDDLPLLRMLLEAGADLGEEFLEFSGDHRRSWTVPMLAAERGNMNALKLLCRNGEDRRYLGTALHLAAAKGHGEIVRFLVEDWQNHPALEPRNELELIDDLGRTPLICAAKEGRATIVEYLIAKGANPHAVYRVRTKEGKDSELANAWIVAAVHKHLEVLDVLLQAGVDANMSLAGGRRALAHTKYITKDSAVGQYLIRRGAKPLSVREKVQPKKAFIF